MDNKIQIYTDKVAKIVAKFPEITRAVVIGNAINDNFVFDNDENIWLAIYTKPGTKYSKTCCELNRTLGENNLAKVDIYPMADEDFYVEANKLIDSGKVIFERK